MDFKHSQSSTDDPEKNAIQQLRSPPNHFGCFTEPRRIEELLKSPLHFKEVANCPSKSLNAFGSRWKGICMQPRSTKELKQSPLHLVPKHVLPRSASKSHLKECGRPSGRKLDFTKEILNQMESRIVSYLKSLKDFQTIVQSGLQKVSLNDYMRILSHLLTFTGIRLKPLDRDNQIEQSILAMRQLKYPYRVNKSWMLVPSSSFQNVLLLFDFLLDFAPQTDESFDLQVGGLIAFNKNELSDRSDVRLKQELVDIESQLLGQAQENDSISQQLDHKLQFKAEIQAELNGEQEKLNALLQKSAKHELNMGRLCLQIWRSEKQRKELKNRLSQELSSHQAYSHILEESNNRRLLHCIKAQELSERTCKELKNKIGTFNFHMRQLYNIFGNHFNWLELPSAPTLPEIRNRQLQLKQRRQQI
ncbi:uncharacterized protein LOC115564863, partial [Drosophila navojoa]|uniref:uncharacterized protein LOC115564863 n=1 Tax=Drosophila navojoa TaxID=7232 RepID=UPI0011BDF181